MRPIPLLRKDRPRRSEPLYWKTPTAPRNESLPLEACLVIGIASAENRRAEIDTLLSAYRLVAEGPDLASALAMQCENTPMLADTLTGLGQATGFAGDPKSGLTFVKRALAIREGEAPIKIAETLNLMGTLSYQANEKSIF